MVDWNKGVVDFKCPRHEQGRFIQCGCAAAVADTAVSEKPDPEQLLAHPAFDPQLELNQCVFQLPWQRISLGGDGIVIAFCYTDRQRIGL